MRLKLRLKKRLMSLTLTEVLAVIAIIWILSGIAAGAVTVWAAAG